MVSGPPLTSDKALAICSKVFRMFDRDLQDSYYCGSTVSLGIINIDTGMTYFIHVGDSRIVWKQQIDRNGILGHLLFGSDSKDDKTEILGETKDHSPRCITEKVRIKKSGGYVEDDRVFGSLAVSRAIGDHAFKPSVSNVPQLNGPFIFRQGDYFVIASDGLWDVKTSNEIIDSVRDEKDVHAGSKHLVNLSNSTDDVTVVFVRFI